MTATDPTASFTEVAVLDAPPERVFAVLTDPELAPKIDPGIVYWRPEDVPPRVGTRNHLKVRGPLGIRIRAISVFAAYVPPHRFVLRSVRPAWPVSVTATALCDPVAGGTVLTYTVEFRGPTPLARLLCRTMQRNIRRGTLLLAAQL